MKTCGNWNVIHFVRWVLTGAQWALYLIYRVEKLILASYLTHLRKHFDDLRTPLQVDTYDPLALSGKVKYSNKSQHQMFTPSIHFVRIFYPRHDKQPVVIMMIQRNSGLLCRQRRKLSFSKKFVFVYQLQIFSFLYALTNLRFVLSYFFLWAPIIYTRVTSFYFIFNAISLGTLNFSKIIFICY